MHLPRKDKISAKHKDEIDMYFVEKITFDNDINSTGFTDDGAP